MTIPPLLSPPSMEQGRGAIYFPHVYGSGGKPQEPTGIGEMRQAIVDFVNAERSDRGLVELTHHAGLMEVAQLHADDMAQQDYYSHDSIDGREWWQRVLPYYPNWKQAGECIAAGYKRPASVVRAWMLSPGHRGIIIDAAYRDIGVGYAVGEGTRYRTYWVLDVGVTR